jgi:predicted O-linked N-acetylglucosamine transferase (SPINDLY family)/outer membrane protein assembly factor BamD (BamD/ComL family)
MELTIEQALQQGVAAHNAGNLQEAEPAYKAILQSQPKHPEANHNLGLIAISMNQVEAALPLFKTALNVNPNIEQFWISYIDALVKAKHLKDAKQAIKKAKKKGFNAKKLQALFSQSTVNADTKVPSQQQLSSLLEYYETGQYGDAEKLAKSFTQQFPQHQFGWKVLGAVLKQTGSITDSLTPMQKSVQLVPQDAGARNNLGTTLQELGRLDEAEACYKQAIVSQPDLAVSHYNLGITLNELSRLDEAEACYKQAIVLKPDYAEAYSNLGITLQELFRFDEAEASYNQAIALKPDYVDAHYNLGITLQELGRLDEAEVSFRQAIVLKPDLADAHNNLGNTLQNLGRLDEAESCYKQAIVSQPDSAEAHLNLGSTLHKLGRFDEAEVSLRQAIALKPDYVDAWDNLLFMLNYNPRLSSAELYREYEAYGTFVSSKTLRRFDHSNHLSTAGRRIRVGYSSPDFRDHACRFFMEPMFREHDRDQFELFAYSNTKNTDHHTERFKSYFDQWIDVSQLSDEVMAERIYDDGIDILVEMAGHTSGNRLVVFAMRPAPIQVGSAIGYGYTTGLKEMDYFIGDENLTPEGSEPYFSEELFRVPGPPFVYEPPRDTIPDVSDLPALRKGYVTFGSLTRTSRLNDPLLAVWKKILDRVPGSRLRLDQKPFKAEGMRELFWQRLEGLGIPRERVELTCSQPHWLAYQDIDITLDCWPHNAGTTTIESLWMGVPVLSKVDRPSMGCVGASMLKPLSLENWVVEDEAAYIEKAVDYASDLTALSKLRSDLRQRLEKSSLLDAAACTQKAEDAYRQMLAKRGQRKL